jgi:hypothetical protein
MLAPPTKVAAKLAITFHHWPVLRIIDALNISP